MSTCEKTKNIRSAKRGVLTVILVLGVLISTPLHAQTGVVVNELLTRLQETLVTVREAVSEEGLPPLSKATIKLKSTFTQGGDGRVSLVAIIFRGPKVKKDAVMEISLEVGPPKDSDRSPVSSSDDPLAVAIIEALTVVKKAEDFKPPLHLRTLTAVFRFVVIDREGFEILPLGLGIGADLNSNAIHELILEFER